MDAFRKGIWNSTWLSEGLKSSVSGFNKSASSDRQKTQLCLGGDKQYQGITLGFYFQPSTIKDQMKGES